jgi:tight adherence protein C
VNIFVVLAFLLIAGGIFYAVWTFIGGDKGDRVSADDLLGVTIKTGSLREAVMTQSAKDRAVLPFVHAVLGRIRRVSPVGWIESTERKLAMSTLTHWSIERVIAMKIIGLLVGLFVAYTRLPINGRLDFILVLGLPPLGFFLADILIRNNADKRQAEIQKQLPDILDQVTIGVEAGLGFDAALTRAAKANSGPLAEEISRTLAHVTAGLSRAEAMRGLANRTKVPELRQFVGAILQAEQYGVPMAQVLRVQAAEQRRKRRQRAEEQAMKLPVKVLFPLVLCILPALFIVLVGPAGLKMAESF